MEIVESKVINPIEHFYLIKEYIDSVPSIWYLEALAISIVIWFSISQRQKFNSLICSYLERKLNKRNLCRFNELTKKANQTSKSKYNTYYIDTIKTNNLGTGLCLFFMRSFIFYFLVIVNLWCLVVSIGQIYFAKYGILSGRQFLFLLICACHCAYKKVKCLYPMLVAQINDNDNIINKVGKWNKNEVTFEKAKQSTLICGDVIHLQQGDVIPADCILLSSYGEVVVDESQKDGEIIQKIKYNCKLPFKPKLNESIEIYNNKIHLYDNNNLENEYHISIEKGDTNYLVVESGLPGQASKWITRFPINKENVIYAGTRITGGMDVIALVAIVGNDCEIRPKKTSISRRPTNLQMKIESICIFNILPLLFFSFSMAIIMHVNFEDGPSLVNLFVQSILFLNTIIPLSLQFYFQMSAETVAERISKEHNVKITNKGALAIQNVPTVIVTDKTGTLTLNKTNFLGIVTEEEYKDEKSNQELIIRRIMACNESRLQLEPLAPELLEKVHKTPEKFSHSFTTSHVASCGRASPLLNIDPIDYNLLVNQNVELLNNVFGDDGYVSWRNLDDNSKMTLTRIYFKPFDHKTEVKCAIVETRSKEYELHVQGTPEAIQKYSRDTDEIPRLLKIEDARNVSLSCYKRIIASGSRKLTILEVEDFMSDEEARNKKLSSLLQDLTNLALYVFEDALIPRVDESIKYFLDNGVTCCICTGDRYETTLDVLSGLLGVTPSVLTAAHPVSFGTQDASIDNKSYTFKNYDVLSTCTKSTCGIKHYVLSDPKDFDNVLRAFSKSSYLLVDGRNLDKLINGQTGKDLYSLIKSSRITAVYRANPHSKQKFVAFLSSMNNRVLMIGDGANDEGAILEADIGVACKGESKKLNHICDVSIDNWNQLPALLKDCKVKTELVENVCKWNMTQHMMKAYSNLCFFCLSLFTLLEENESFILMLMFKSTQYILSYFYCRYESLGQPFFSFYNIMIKAALVGLCDAFLIWFYRATQYDIDNAYDIKNGANMLMPIYIFQLFGILWKFRNSRWQLKELILVFIIGCIWLSYFVANCENFGFIVSIMALTLISF